VIRSVNEEELRRIGLILRSIKNSCSWELNDEKDSVPRALCAAIVAQISYCLIKDDERERHNRAKVVPSDWHYQLVQSERLDIIEILRRSDIPNIELIENKYFVVIAFCLGDIIFIGVRGTQFAYDWIKNIKLLRTKDSHFGTSSVFHRGFYNEAVALDCEIVKYLQRATLQNNRTTSMKICICGHSLGGAIAALILQSRSIGENPFCYTFGAPRITNKKGQNNITQPVTIRTALDVVPHCPPKLAGYYADFLNQRNTNGSIFNSAERKELVLFPTWIRKLLIYEGVKNHSVEIYRSEIRKALEKSHPNINQCLVELESRKL